MSEKFNFEEALKALQSGQAITGKDGVLAPLIKRIYGGQILTQDIIIEFAMGTSVTKDLWGGLQIEHKVWGRA